MGTLISQDRLRVVVAPSIVVLATLGGYLIRRQVLARAADALWRCSRDAEAAFVTALERPLPLWCCLGGIYLATLIVGLPGAVARSLAEVLTAALIVSGTLWVADLAVRLLAVGARDSEGAGSATGAVRSVVRIGVLMLGGAMLLKHLGISVAPLVTTMGLGGLAVALGLRETLTNLFAGMQITLGGNIRVGDFIKLESGDEGYVEDIHWRVTRIRTLLDTVVLIPNNRLAESVVTNYHRPRSDVLVGVRIGVHQRSDLEEVERITREVGAAVIDRVEGAVTGAVPIIRYRAFGESSVDLDVFLRVRDFGDNLRVKHDFIKALVRAYAAAGVVMPYPVRALNLQQEQDRPR
jgi:small-conductance mechanosensitive channel